jgi:hypothetical protein
MMMKNEAGLTGVYVTHVHVCLYAVTFNGLLKKIKT